MPPKRNKKESGQVVSIFRGVGKVVGLSRVFLHETLVDEDGQPTAIVFGFSEDYVEALFFSDSFSVNSQLYRSGRIFSVPVKKSVIGRVVNALGVGLDGLGPMTGKRTPVFKAAPQIIDRQPVHQPLTTGIKIVDTALPLGRGQRELIIGDRKLGKSTLAIDTVLNQKNAEPPVTCVYVICGQKRQKLDEIITVLENENAFLHTVVVAATANSSYAEQYLAPFVGCAIGEYFRDLGGDALVVYDDLSKHAKAYRDVSLLLERAPGREAYPGDIFSLHAGLLERAAKLSDERGSGSLTALPIIETQEGDITSFIPTNLVSITDGQFYFERSLYQNKFQPAINVGLSVSRVGSQAQPEPVREVTGGIRLALAQHKELQRLAQLETLESEEAKKNIHRGDLLLELLKQDKNTKVTWPEQVVLFFAVEEGYLDGFAKEDWRQFEDLLLQLMRNRHTDTLELIAEKGLTKKCKDKISAIVDDFMTEFVS